LGFLDLGFGTGGGLNSRHEYQLLVTDSIEKVYTSVQESKKMNPVV
jgi:hypothetical protein